MAATYQSDEMISKKHMQKTSKTPAKCRDNVTLTVETDAAVERLGAGNPDRQRFDGVGQLSKCESRV